MPRIWRTNPVVDRALVTRASGELSDLRRGDNFDIHAREWSKLHKTLTKSQADIKKHTDTVERLTERWRNSVASRGRQDLDKAAENCRKLWQKIKDTRYIVETLNDQLLTLNAEARSFLARNIVGLEQARKDLDENERWCKSHAREHAYMLDPSKPLPLLRPPMPEPRSSAQWGNGPESYTNNIYAEIGSLFDNQPDAGEPANIEPDSGPGPSAAANAYGHAGGHSTAFDRGYGTRPQHSSAPGHSMRLRADELMYGERPGTARSLSEESASASPAQERRDAIVPGGSDNND